MENLLNNSTNSIQLVSSGEARTVQSLDAFIDGLPRVITPLLDYEPGNPTLLHFNKNTDYVSYLAKDKQLKEKIRSIRMQPYSKKMARNILERLFQISFVDKLANGYYSAGSRFSNVSMTNEVDAVLTLYHLYRYSWCLIEEGAGSLLGKYFNKKEVAWFGYVSDAKVNISLRIIWKMSLINVHLRNTTQMVQDLPVKE